MKELKLSLLNHYLLVMEMVKEERYMHDIEEILIDTNTFGSLWRCARLCSGANIESLDNGTKLPYFAATKSEVLSRLQIRVDILQKEIATP